MGWDNSDFFLHCLPGLPGRMEPSGPVFCDVAVFCLDNTLLIFSLLHSLPSISWGHLPNQPSALILVSDLLLGVPS